MRIVSGLVGLFIVMSLLAAPAAAQNQLVCGKPTGNPVPEWDFVPGEDDEYTAREFDQAIVDYLNVTGSAEHLEASMETFLRDRWVNAQVLETDVTGDRRPDVLVMTNQVFGIHAGFTMILSLFTCTHGSYVTLGMVRGGGMDGSDNQTPAQLLFVTDLNNNGLRDMVVRQKNAWDREDGDRLYIYEWQGTALKEVYALIPAYGTFSSITADSRDNDPATLELVVGSVYGYGESVLEPEAVTAVRTTAYVIGWNGRGYAERCRYFTDDSTLRVDVLQKAESLRACGDLDGALALYQRLYDDTNLRGWTSAAGEINEAAAKIERDYLTAFAGYRLVQLYLLPDRFVPDGYDRLPGSTYAAELVAALQEVYPAGTQGHMYAAMAQALWDSYTQTPDMTTACTAAEAAYHAAVDTGTDPGIDTPETASDAGRVRHKFYEFSGIPYSSDPNAIFDVPPEISDMVQISVCLE